MLAPSALLVSHHSVTGASPSEGLLGLSPELILEIASHIFPWNDFRQLRRDSNMLARSTKHSRFTLGQATLANLRLVCRYLSEVLEHEISRSLTFDFHVTRVSETDVEYQLALLAQGRSPASRHAMFLNIKCLDPIQEGYSPEGQYFSPRSPGYDRKMNFKATRIAVLRDSYLAKAVSSFQNLRCVAWNIEKIDVQSIHVMGTLSALPSLEDLTLRIGPMCEEPSKLLLYKFHDLHSLAISFINHPRYFGSPGVSGELHEQAINHISQIIGQSPMLRNLSVLQPARSRYDLSIRNLLKVPAAKPLAHLEMLHLSLPDMMLDNDTAISHLKALKVLRIEGSAHPICTGAEIWGPLAAVQIKLQEITVSHLSEPLLAYLASYTGLKKLHVLLTYYPHGESTRCDTRTFFKNILPLHALSPTINSARPGDQFQPSAKDGLIFEVDSHKQALSNTKVPSWPITVCIDSVPDALWLMLESVTQVPECRTNRLEVFYSSTMMYFGCGTGMMQHHRSNSAAGHKWLSDLEVTDSLERYPPIVSLGHKEFHLKASADKEGIYSYRPIERSERSNVNHRMHFYSESDSDD